ncbi:MAG TPA: DNA polymerase Y family protein [Terriglobales bacterium]|nr:DNA polymerase Y family protein [Terriglobales bacterium]
MFACLYVPDFVVQASLLTEPAETRVDLKQSPIAILEGPASLPRVFATNPTARRAGIQAGMTKLQVETYGGVLLRKRMVAEEESAQAVLVSLASSFSPRVESTSPGVAIIDLAGTEKLFGVWQSTVRAIAAKASAVGFDLRVAVSSNPDSALLAAQGFSANTIIPAGAEASRLAPLPIGILPMSSEMLGVFDGWGIRTFQALTALPQVAIVERLGQEGMHLQKLALGQIERPLVTVEPNAEFIESFEFDDPVETLESLAFILNRLLGQLCSRLIASSLAINALRLALELEVRRICGGNKGEPCEHNWKLPVPTQDRHMLFGLVRLYLERLSLTAPVKRLTVEATPVRPRVAQGDLFTLQAPETEKLEITLERIRGVVGDSDAEGVACVGTPCLLDTHKPDSFTVQHFSSLDIPSDSSQAAPVSALRIFRPAIETSVELDGDKPHFVRLWHGRRYVFAASGPWSSSGDWWNASVWARQEWDVALKTPEGVGFYRIYRDCIRQQWFVEGVFD